VGGMTAGARWFYLGILITSCLIKTARAQQSFTWQQIKDKFEAANPTLKAVQLNIDESRAAEITAYLRPNPDFSLTADGVQISRNLGVWRPLNGVVETPSVSYLHERQHERELRRDAARQSTDCRSWRRQRQP
jgi:cobalt-zinc-cadmium efflux system outer membrane protein